MLQDLVEAHSLGMQGSRIVGTGGDVRSGRYPMAALVPVTTINFALYASQAGGISSFKAGLDSPPGATSEVFEEEGKGGGGGGSGLARPSGRA